VTSQYIDARTRPFPINRDESCALPVCCLSDYGRFLQAVEVFRTSRCACYATQPGRRRFSRGLNSCGRVVGSGERGARIERAPQRSPEIRSPDSPTAVRCFDSLDARRPNAKLLAEYHTKRGLRPQLLRISDPGEESVQGCVS